MPHHGSEFVRYISNAFVMSQGNAIVSAAILEPFFVQAPFIEDLIVTLDDEARRSQSGGEALAEIAIREIDATQSCNSRCAFVHDSLLDLVGRQPVVFSEIGNRLA